MYLRTFHIFSMLNVSDDGATYCVFFLLYPSSRCSKNHDVSEIGRSGVLRDQAFVFLPPEDGSRTNFRNVVLFKTPR
jgi:hypothetical protein